MTAPAPKPSRVAATSAMRSSAASTPSVSASPPHTPPSIRSVRLRIGPVGLVGQGVGRLRTRDARARRAVVEVTSRDGDEVGTVTITVTPAGAEHSTVAVHADLRAPRAGGRLGRSVVTDVGNRMVHRASTALAARLGDAERVPAAADGSRVMRLPRLVLPAVAGAATVTAGITVAVVRRVLGRR